MLHLSWLARSIGKPQNMLQHLTWKAAQAPGCTGMETCGAATQPRHPLSRTTLLSAALPGQTPLSPNLSALGGRTGKGCLHHQVYSPTITQPYHPYLLLSNHILKLLEKKARLGTAIRLKLLHLKLRNAFLTCATNRTTQFAFRKK